MPYEHDNQGHLLIIVSVLMAIYAVAFGNHETAYLFLAVAGILLASHQAAAYWPKIHEFLRHRTYLIMYHFHLIRS